MANIHRLGDLGDNNNPQNRNMRLGNNGAFPLNFNSAADNEAQGINIPFMSKKNAIWSLKMVIRFLFKKPKQICNLKDKLILAKKVSGTCSKSTYVRA